MTRFIIYLMLLFFPMPILAEGEVITLAQCKLGWDASPESPLGYRIYWGDTPDIYPNSFDVGDTLVTTCTDMGITSAGQYHFAARAYNLGGESVNSNVLPLVLLPPVPSAPSNLRRIL